ncbi:hypothetical protein [Roseibaca sp. Y0-43]|uniref:hypothetical protein n=1 Tax=Roseibaca sp. Y0-43 TaxID=2816854 RepID=UPI001D0C0053|nr:hypothetical protein [Roseibaca sp. Y0-43]MCC1480451.1 hypothetical protein [Roseibaca sp. Y0-43]
MSTFPQSDANRLSRHARLAAFACRATGIAIPAFVALFWLSGHATGTAVAELGLPPGHTLSSVQTGAALVFSLIPAILTARALFALASCFDGFASRNWFGRAQPRALSTTGIWLMAAGLAALATPTLIGLALSLNAAPGQRVLAFSLSSDGVLALLFGLAFWMLGHLWTIARNIAAENAEFV